MDEWNRLGGHVVNANMIVAFSNRLHKFMYSDVKWGEVHRSGPSQTHVLTIIGVTSFSVNLSNLYKLFPPFVFPVSSLGPTGLLVPDLPL